MTAQRKVAVFGAYGHTAGFIIAELLQRGLQPVPSGRDRARLEALARHLALDGRQASIDDPASLDCALAGCVAVIHCAGPYGDSAVPVIESALRAGIHYLDLSAEQQATLHTFDHFDHAARQAGSTLLPSMAFYGGLADLLATAAFGDWPDADRIDIAVALDRWHPTAGTRRTGARNTAPRQVIGDGRLTLLADPPPTCAWTFPAPFGTQSMVALPLSEIITLSRHLHSREVHSHMNLAPLRDLRDPATPPPQPADARGRSAQRFAMEARVSRNGTTRHALAQGRDIYAISAPLVVEALQRLLRGDARPGVLAPGDAFDAADMLGAIADLQVTIANGRG